MGLVKRITDILSSNVNELVEKYENPELLLKQAVREMEESIRVALEHAAKVIADEKLLLRQLAAEESAAQAWQRRAEKAVQKSDDSEAKGALRHKRDHEAIIASLTTQLAEVAHAGKSLRQQIDVMRSRVHDANRKLVLLAARQRTAEARQRLLRQFSDLPLGEDAFHKFDRMCRKVERTEAEADALAELTHYRDPSEEVDTEDQIEAELRELKAR
jgi:phage shock protein A